MAHSSWGLPCKGTIKTLVRSDGLKLPLRLEIVELVALLIDETERQGYDVKPGETWGNSCRKIRNSSNWSNHAWGLAVDINAPSNPYTTKLITDMPSWMPKLWKSYGFRWGGDYSIKKDAMHYEFLGSVEDAIIQTQRARRELTGKKVTVLVPAYDTLMQIKPENLLAQFDRASQEWPFLEDVEKKYGLPTFTLYALGSRETNLTNISNKDATDRGIWQRNKIHGFPDNWMQDILGQAQWTANYLKKQIDRFGFLGGLNAYNSGSPLTERTAGKNYGPDVMARREFLINNITQTEEDEEMIKFGLVTFNTGQPTFGVFVIQEKTVLNEGKKDELVLLPGMIAKVGITNGAVLQALTNSRQAYGPVVTLDKDAFDRIPLIGNI